MTGWWRVQRRLPTTIVGPNPNDVALVCYQPGTDWVDFLSVRADTVGQAAVLARDLCPWMRADNARIDPYLR